MFRIFKEGNEGITSIENEKENVKQKQAEIKQIRPFFFKETTRNLINEKYNH